MVAVADQGAVSTVVYPIITVHNFIYKVKDMYENEKMYGKEHQENMK